jgi:hypothetical protein
MAPRTAKQVAEDGAKPGSGTRTPADKQAFNAEARAKEREEQEIVLGEDETPYFRRRKNWQVTRDLRSLLRKQEASQLGIQRINKQIAELPIEDDPGSLEDKVDALGDEGDLMAYEIIALLLRDEEGNPPPIEMLKESIDVDDIGALASRLAGGGEPVADPTVTPST